MPKPQKSDSKEKKVDVGDLLEATPKLKLAIIAG